MRSRTSMTRFAGPPRSLPSAVSTRERSPGRTTPDWRRRSACRRRQPSVDSTCTARGHSRRHSTNAARKSQVAHASSAWPRSCWRAPRFVVRVCHVPCSPRCAADASNACSSAAASSRATLRAQHGAVFERAASSAVGSTIVSRRRMPSRSSWPRPRPARAAGHQPRRSRPAHWPRRSARLAPRRPAPAPRPAAHAPSSGRPVSRQVAASSHSARRHRRHGRSPSRAPAPRAAALRHPRGHGPRPATVPRFNSVVSSPCRWPMRRKTARIFSYAASAPSRRPAGSAPSRCCPSHGPPSSSPDVSRSRDGARAASIAAWCPVRRCSAAELFCACACAIPRRPGA